MFTKPMWFPNKDGTYVLRNNTLLDIIIKKDMLHLILKIKGYGVRIDIGNIDSTFSYIARLAFNTLDKYLLFIFFNWNFCKSFK
jgi:hypothetical protein